MELIMNTINTVRNIRGVMNIGPSKKLRVLISVPDADLLSLMEAGKGYIQDIANLDELAVAVNAPEPKGTATGVIGSVRVYVFLEGVVDVAAEKKRLEKEIKKIEKTLSFVSKKLGNRDFVEKASPEIVEKEETKFSTLREKSQVLEDALGRLRDMD